MIEDRVLARLTALLEQAPSLADAGEEGGTIDFRHDSECSGWIASAQNAVHLVCPNPQAPYRTTVDRLVKASPGYNIPTYVSSIAAVIERLLVDAKEGLLASVASRARAEVFDDFLDHAKHYQRNGKKNEAGTIAGVVFEDSLRRLCDKLQIAQKGQEIEQLIVSLTRADALTATKAKRARVAAHVRTKATHAQWDEFDSKDVDATLEFVGELIPMLES